MHQAIAFVETTVFTKQISALASDEDLWRLQLELIAQPTKGDLIRNTGGLRKIRMATSGLGKSSSLRVIYFLAHAEKIYLLLAYPKSTKDDLTAAEKSVLKQLVNRLKGEK
ncbi:type II toxin-antitoxin system RelE/ParE family toxin [Parahaliea mediterranea]|uniref:type II toxin-antitoxin system RelE/ParE family toxin n=1 Tax=Parahaliea mediterranea TaxID=651086 RepID=UPI000E2F49C9|nr:type II toxin-antitoxin system RelE/ParE family toxin [Parahaliea mediterranea]